MPHDIVKADVRKKVVIIGAGPGGLEAARVAAERGHQVVVLEAAAEPGGQIRLTAQTPRRAEMMQIINWRMAQCQAKKVEFHFNTWAQASDVKALNPDVVIVATGGMPDTDVLASGNELAVSSWDILSGDAKFGKNVLIFDDAGDHPALQAAELLANSGAKVEIMTPDRSFSPDVMAMNLVPYMRSLQDKDVTFTVTYRVASARRIVDQIELTLSSDYGSINKTRLVDQLVINHGTLPLDGLYFDLKHGASNQGELDHRAFIKGLPQTQVRNPGGSYQLFRIGDAVAARNTHAAIYDGLRLAKDI